MPDSRSGRIRGLIAGAALVVAFVLVLAVLTGSALAGFAAQSTVVVEGNANLGQSPLAVDGAGRTTITWFTTGNPVEVVHVRRVAANGTGGSPITVSAPTEDSVNPSVASDAAGRSFVAWSVFDAMGMTESVKGRWVEANGARGPILTLNNGTTSAAGTQVQVVIAPSGTATVTWVDQNDSNKLRAIRVSPTGALSPIVPDMSGGGSGPAVRVAALADGTTLAAWRSGGIESNTLSPSGTVGTPASLTSGGLVSDPFMAVDGQGDALVAWRLQMTVPDRWAVNAHLLDSTGSPVGSEFAIDPLASPGVGFQIGVAADSTRHFLVTWDRQDSNHNGVGFARSVDKDGTLGVTHPFTTGPGSENQSVAALLDRGSAGVMWSFSGPVANQYGTRGRALSANGAPLGGVVPLTQREAFPAVASLPSANVAAFLAEVFAPGKQILRLFRFLSPPICSSSNAKTEQAAPVNVALACSGPAITGVQVTKPPKHGKVGSFNAGRRTVRYTPSTKFVGTDTFTYRAVNGGGKSNAVTVKIRVVRDKDRPRITSFALVKSGTGKKKTLRFVLTFGERVTVKVKVFQRVNGRFQRIGVLSSKKFRTSASLRVPPTLAQTLRGGGKFRATAVATDPPGNRSKPKSLAIP